MVPVSAIPVMVVLVRVASRLVVPLLEEEEPDTAEPCACWRVNGAERALTLFSLRASLLNQSNQFDRESSEEVFSSGDP